MIGNIIDAAGELRTSGELQLCAGGEEMLRWVTLSTPTSDLFDAHVEAQSASPLGDLVGFQNSIKATDLQGFKPRVRTR